MGFLSPWFLAGLAGAAIPIYFHLLRQHKSTPRPFSSLMFFERTTQSSIKHRRIRFWALLAFRLALLILLALAFASPFVMRDVAAIGEGRRHIIYVVDVSFSMREGDRLETAKQEALSAVSAFREGNEAQVATLASRLEFLTQPTSNRGELTAAVQSILPGDARSSFGELARALRAMGETSRFPLEVHLFSDMQQSSMPSGFADLQLPPRTRFLLHPVVDDLTPNFAVESVTAPASLFNPSKATVQATVSGFGTHATRQTVSLSTNGKVLDSTSVDVPANGRATVEFHSLDVPYGFSKCEVSIPSADALPGDDRFLFAVERADPRQALFLHRRGSLRDLVYFRAALEASPNAAFRLQAVPMDQAGGVDPSRYAVVVLSDVGALPAQLEQNLKQYLRGGGGILIAGGPATARLAKVPVVDLPVNESAYAARGVERFFAAGPSDISHPAVGLKDMWEGVKFFQAVRVNPSDARTLARLADETPLLLERPAGEGRSLFFASTFDNVSNDFPLSPSFVAFVERAMNYLGRIEDRTAQRAVEEFVDLRRGGSSMGVEVIDPEGARAISLDEAAGAESVRVERIGFYELRRANSRNEMIAVNADRRESNLAVVPSETQSLWQNTGEEPITAETVSGSGRTQWKLWWYVLLLGVVAAAGETFLAARYLGVDRGQYERS